MTSAGQSSTASNSILLVNPPNPPGLTANREGAGGLGAWSSGEGGFSYPPQTLALSAAILRARGTTVGLLDASGQGLDAGASLRALAEHGSPMVAVLVSHIALDNDIAFLNQARQAAPNSVLLAIGNSTVYIEPQLRERTDADHIVIGEAEAMLAPVIQALRGESSVRRLRRSVTASDLGAAGIDQDGRVANLDDLPFPAWDLVPIDRYGFLTVSTSRGCDDVCTFCPYATGQGRHLRLRSPRLVADEMAWLERTYQPSRIIIRDPVFAANREHVEQICRELLSRKVNIHWECESRPEHFDLDLLRVMQRAGCAAIKLGFETTSQEVLRTLRRIPENASASAYVESAASVISACRKLGLACRVFVMTGLPGQTGEDIAQTAAFLQHVRPTGVHIKAFHRYPGLAVPSADAAEEQERGRQQERMLADAAANAAAPRSAPLLHRIRGWLRRGKKP